MEESKIKLSAVFSDAIEFWKQNLKLILVLGLTVYLPVQILIEVVSYFLNGLFTTVDLNTIKLMNNIYEFIRYLIGSVASLGIIFITYSKCSATNDQYTAKQLLIYGLKRWPKLMLADIIAGFKILLYLLLLIIPGVYKGVKLSFVDCNVSTKEQSAEEACDYSESLVGNRWWLVAGFLLLVFICEFLLEAIFAILFLGLLDSTIIVIIFGVVIKLLETYFIVLKAVFYFKVEKCIPLPKPRLNTTASLPTADKFDSVVRI